LSKLKEKPTSVTLFPYVQTTYGHLSRMLPKHILKCVDLLHRSITSLLHLVKDDLGVRNMGYTAYPASVVRCTSDRLVDP
jgi:hypothetical protein